MRSGIVIFIAFTIILQITAISSYTTPLANAVQGTKPSTTNQRVYLPIVHTNDSFAKTPSLWSHRDVPQAHEITLLRCMSEISTPLSDAELQIFADTRYEAWLNGSFIGRGPARFSQVRREYDVIQLGTLTTGQHLIAVLAQWAPNLRRSESIMPQVQARIIGSAGGVQRLITLGATDCVTQRSSAWQNNPAPVHTWNIFGPTELIDLRKLPENWNKVSFNDSNWEQAIVRPSSTQSITYQPRSIAQTTNVAIAPRIHAVGRLAPESWVGELVATTDGSDSYTFSLSSATNVTIQALAAPGQPALASTATLDGETLNWSVLPDHPDRYQTRVQLDAGSHQLQATGLTPGDSWVFSITSAHITTSPPTLGIGNHAGRRLLVPDMIANATTVTQIGTSGFDLRVQPGASYVIIDLGRTVYGRIEATVAGSAGTLIDIGWDERLWRNVRPLPYPGSLHPEWNQSDSWILASTQRTLTTIDARAGRYILIAIWSSTPTTLYNVRVFEERYPLVERGKLETGSPRLDTIWQVGVNTLLPSMNDAYADPWRERGQWWGDAHIADQVNQVAFGDSELLRRGLLQMADSVGNSQPTALAPSGYGLYLIDYGMYWVQSTYDYGRRTGNWAFVESIYPQIQIFMEYLASIENPQSGLLDMDRASPATIYIDSISYWDRRGQTTAANAFYYGTLLASADIASQLGRTNQAIAWRQRASTVRTQTNQLLYVPAEGRYRAGIYRGQIQEPTPQAQATALAFGLVPNGEEQNVADSLLSMLGTPDAPGVQILGSYMVLKGLGRIGRIDDALDIIDRFFGSVIDRGATTWWENFIADKIYTQSLSHAWGGSPTWFMSTYLLGARQVSPTIWEVRVPITTRSGASGQIPLAGSDGNLSIEWSAGTCRQISVTVNSPNATSGSVLIPGLITDTIWLDQVKIWSADQAQAGAAITFDGTMFTIMIGSAEHRIETQRICTQPLSHTLLISTIP